MCRPLAKSNVGTIIVIAHRLRMSWIGEFDPNDGKMNAQGCGHTFTSETVRGLGMVLEYSSHKESKAIRNARGARKGLGAGEYLSPTVTADKLRCSIIPIDPAAVPGEVQDEVLAINTSRQVDIVTLTSRLGLPMQESDRLRDNTNHNAYGVPGRALKHAIEEAVSLLCPIPTLPDSKARWIVGPFRSVRQPYTPLRQRPGLRELRNRLSEYTTSRKPGVKIMEDREGTVLQYLNRSPLEYLDIVLDASTYIYQHRNAPQPDEVQKICDLYKQIRDIHRETSEVFAKVPCVEATDEDDARPFILDLVSAQANLATRHGRTADSIALNTRTADMDEYQTPEADSRQQFVIELARLYVDDLENGKEKTVHKHLRRRGYIDILQPGEVSALWWTLVLRGACWWASVRVRLPETHIPSYWYNSQTPIYIT